MKILGKPTRPATKMARTAQTSNIGLYCWSAITVADAMKAIKHCELAEWVVFHETNKMQSIIRGSSVEDKYTADCKG